MATANLRNWLVLFSRCGWFADSQRLRAIAQQLRAIACCVRLPNNCARTVKAGTPHLLLTFPNFYPSGFPILEMATYQKVTRATNPYPAFFSTYLVIWRRFMSHNWGIKLQKHKTKQCYACSNIQSRQNSSVGKAPNCRAAGLGSNPHWTAYTFPF